MCVCVCGPLCSQTLDLVSPIIANDNLLDALYTATEFSEHVRRRPGHQDVQFDWTLVSDNHWGTCDRPLWG